MLERLLGEKKYKKFEPLLKKVGMESADWMEHCDGLWVKPGKFDLSKIKEDLSELLGEVKNILNAEIGDIAKQVGDEIIDQAIEAGEDIAIRKARNAGIRHVAALGGAAAGGVVPGQLKTAEKSNEITAIPELINLLDIKAKIITTDAMGCQKDIAEKIVSLDGDYLFAVKGNQGRLQKAFEDKFPLKELNNPERDSYSTTEKSHGREETRLHIVSDAPDELIDFTFEWKGLKKLCVAVSFRKEIASQVKEPEMQMRYYISSANLTAEKFARSIREHWSIENRLHWCLDTAMNKDNCRIRRGNAAELFSGIRHIAVNILRQEKMFKAGLRRKMRKAAMDRGYQATVLAGCGVS